MVIAIISILLVFFVLVFVFSVLLLAK